MSEQSTLPAAWEVPEVFRNRLGKTAGRQRVMARQGHLLLVLHGPPGPEEIERVGRFFWRKPDGEWLSSDLGRGARALERHVIEYADLLEQYDRRMETATTAEELFGVLHAVSPLRRAAMHLHHVLQEARERCPEDRHIIVLRDMAYEVERTAELLYSEAQNTLEFDIAKKAEEESQSAYQMSLSAHRLNVLVAFFFPIATLAAIFGTNLHHGLENSEGPLPLVVLIAVGLVCGFVLKWFVVRGVHPEARPSGPLRRGTATGHARRAACPSAQKQINHPEIGR